MAGASGRSVRHGPTVIPVVDGLARRVLVGAALMLALGACGSSSGGSSTTTSRPPVRPSMQGDGRLRVAKQDGGASARSCSTIGTAERELDRVCPDGVSDFTLMIGNVDFASPYLSSMYGGPVTISLVYVGAADVSLAFPLDSEVYIEQGPETVLLYSVGRADAWDEFSMSIAGRQPALWCERPGGLISCET